MRTYHGNLQAEGKRFGIIVSRFNEFLTKKLLEGAVDCLERHGVGTDDVTVVWVPGSFEVPLAAKRLAETDQYDAVIALSCLVRGETPHFEYVSAEIAKGVARVALDTGVPIAFGVVTADTLEQAIERTGTKQGNKGFDAALTAIEMADLMQRIS